MFNLFLCLQIQTLKYFYSFVQRHKSIVYFC
nr:MAG TPA: hypothetical protein [Caudoviricetes sp.]